MAITHLSARHQVEHQRRKRGASVGLLLCCLGLAACSGNDGAENGGGDDGGGDRNVGPNGLLSTDKSTYGPSEPIRVTFEGAPGNNGADWIGIYQRGRTPNYGSLTFLYINGSGEIGEAAPASGTVVFDASAVGTRITWPFPAGDYTAWYLVNDLYSSLGSVDFSTTCPSSAPGCDTARLGGPPDDDGGCTADSDCGNCERCERSSGRCISRLSC